MNGPKSQLPLFATASGIKVAGTAPQLRGGKLKVAAYLAATGGWHGWLVVKRLSPLNAAARAISAKAA